MRIRELQRRACDLGLVQLDRRLVLPHQRGLGIHLLFRHRVLGEQGLVTHEIKPALVEKRVVLGELGLILQFLHFERARIEIRQGRTRLHVRALREKDLLQFAIHSAMNRYGVDRRDGAEGDDPDIEIRLLGRLRGDRHRPETGTGANRAGRPGQRSHDERVDKHEPDSDDQQPQQPPFGRLLLVGSRSGRASENGGGCGGFPELVSHGKKVDEAEFSRQMEE